MANNRGSIFLALVAWYLINRVSLTGRVATGGSVFWMSVCGLVFSAGLLVFLIQLIRPSSLVLTPEGFELTSQFTRSGQFYAWDSIAEFSMIYSRPAILGHREIYSRSGLGSGEVSWTFHRRPEVSTPTQRGEPPFDRSLGDMFQIDPHDLLTLLEDWRIRYSESVQTP